MKEKLIELLEKGETREEIMNYFDWTESQFHWYFKKFLPGKSIKHFSKKIKHRYFDNLNSENKCYLLGFFIADGCISSQKKDETLNCFTVTVKREDEEVLNFFRKEISEDINLQRFENKDGYKISKIQWTSETMVEDLYKYITHWQRKSFESECDINLDLIPDKYFGHFLRGLIDGDGTIKKQFPRIEILFSSINIAEKIKNRLNKIFPNYLNIRISKDEYYSKSDNKKRNNTIYRLSISSGERGENDFISDLNILFYINVFYYFLYKNSFFFLKRKKEIFTKYRANFLNKKGLESSVEHRE